MKKYTTIKLAGFQVMLNRTYCYVARVSLLYIIIQKCTASTYSFPNSFSSLLKFLPFFIKPESVQQNQQLLKLTFTQVEKAAIWGVRSSFTSCIHVPDLSKLSFLQELESTMAHGHLHTLYMTT